MKVLVINTGSSSLKFVLFNMDEKRVLINGVCERVGAEGSFIRYGLRENKVKIEVPMTNHEMALAVTINELVNGPIKVIDNLNEIDAVGHRIVQGGKYFDHAVLIDRDVEEKIGELAEIAPLHNMAALKGILACKALMPDKPNVAVFDSAYFSTLPPEANTYPIPFELSEKYDIRRYGAHGSSHRYVAMKAAELDGKPLEELNIITCHLGGGCSMSAIKGGVAIDTSMGLTPLGGIMMGTRCGSIDPSIVTFLMDHESMTPEEASTMMNKKSGFLGVSGISSDVRDVRKAANEGNERAQLALKIFAHTAKKCIGSYLAELGHVDVLVFTAGLGENDACAREEIIEGLDELGFTLDFERNHANVPDSLISTDDSKVRIYVISTREEYMIALDTVQIVSAL